MKLLLVDDDTDLLDVTAYALRREGFNVIVATDGAQALQRFEHEQPDLVVSDVIMPRVDGFDLCQKVRQASTTPVILLTGLNNEEQIIRGFQLGADDYVTKPFSPRQLAMRVRAVWRRGSMLSEPAPTREIRVGELLLDIESHEAWHHETLIQLTPIEFKLLHILCVNYGRVVSSARLVDFALATDTGGFEDFVGSTRRLLRRRQRETNHHRRHDQPDASPHRTLLGRSVCDNKAAIV